MPWDSDTRLTSVILAPSSKAEWKARLRSENSFEFIVNCQQLKGKDKLKTNEFYWTRHDYNWLEWCKNTMHVDVYLCTTKNNWQKLKAFSKLGRTLAAAFCHHLTIYIFIYTFIMTFSLVHLFWGYLQRKVCITGLVLQTDVWIRNWFLFLLLGF